MTDAYFAGFLDADGCISIARRQRNFVLQTRVTNTHRGVCEAFQSRFGGTVEGPLTQGGNRRPHYQWVTAHGAAEKAVTALLPHLFVKQERGLLALRYRRCCRGAFVMPRGAAAQNGQNTEKRARVYRIRERIYMKMKALNHRGARNGQEVCNEYR